MKVTWLSHAGLLFENGEITILVDPYLQEGCDCCTKEGEATAGITHFEICPDVIIITHSHPGHLDKPTLKKILSTDKEITVLAPEAAYSELVKLGGKHNYVLLSPHSVWSTNGVTFYSVRAEHTDRTAAGFIIDDGEKTYYVSGDTLYNFDVIDDVLDLVESGVDVAFLPINGKNNNMNAKDAADFAYEIGAKCAVPIHYSEHDGCSPYDFDFEDARVLAEYETAEF